MTATERLLNHVLETRYDDLPSEAVVAAKTFFLDTLGVTVAGTGLPYAAELRQAVAGWGSGEEASVFGFGNRLPAANAALINGFHAHCQEFDCVHEPAVVHPLATVQSALLAAAERQRNVSGRDLLAALCVGVDVSTAIGTAATSGLRFFRPATAGVFGATAAVARVSGLDRGRLLDALGLALAQAAGTMQAHVEGKPTLALQVGLAARAAVQAVDMAMAGMAGAHDMLEGPYGYLPLFENGGDLQSTTASLGRLWRITEVSHKPFPSGRATHGGIDAIQQLKRDGLPVAQVAAVELHAPPLIQQLVGRPLKPDMQVNYARLCFQYVAAVALTEATVDVPHFQSERLSDRSLLALADRIRVVTDDNPDPNALGPQRLEVELQDGSRQTLTVTDVIGSPANPLSVDAHLDKFRRCLGYGVRPLSDGAADRLIEQVDRLPQQQNLADFFALLAPPSE